MNWNLIIGIASLFVSVVGIVLGFRYLNLRKSQSTAINKVNSRIIGRSNKVETHINERYK